TPRASGVFAAARERRSSHHGKPNKGADMETQAGKPLHPLVWVAGIALIVLCGVGAAALMGWIGTGKAVEQGPITKLESARTPERAHLVAKLPQVAICLECGVVQSVHEVDTKGAGSGVGAVGGAVVGGVLG